MPSLPARPRIFFLGPPQAVIRLLPMIPPRAPADSTNPKVAALLLVLERIKRRDQDGSPACHQVARREDQLETETGWFFDKCI